MSSQRVWLSGHAWAYWITSLHGGGAWLSPGGAQRHINTHTAGGKNKTRVTPVGLPVIPHQDLIGNILSLKINFPLCFI